MKRWPAALICDLDGTLIDSAPDVAAAASRALAAHEMLIDARQARRWLGRGAKVFMRRAAEHFQLAADDQTLDRWIADFSAAYAAAPCAATRTYDDALDALAALRGRGLDIAVCTNKPEAIARLVLEQTGLADRVDVLIGAGDRPLKPAPDGLLACLDALDVAAADALYVGDDAVDVEAGHAAGLRVALAAFGYGRRSAGRCGADAELRRWSEIAAVIDRLGP